MKWTVTSIDPRLQVGENALQSQGQEVMYESAVYSEVEDKREELRWVRGGLSLRFVQDMCRGQ